MPIILKPKRCPSCRADWSSLRQVLYGDANLQGDPKAGYDFAGDTTVDWNSQEDAVDAKGRVLATCANGHDHRVKVREE